MKSPRLAVALLAAAFGGPAFAQPIAHWAFDGNANDSVGGVNGALAGPAGFAPGVAGQCLDLTVGGWCTMGNNFPFVPGGDFTVSCWVRTGSSGAGGHVVAKHDASAALPNGYMLAFDPSGGYGGAAGEPWFYASDAVGGEATASGVSVNTGWHHVVGVHREDPPPTAVDLIYVDGAPFDGPGIQNTVATTLAEFAVGAFRMGGTLTNTYMGYVDDVQLYDYALCPTEVQELYDNPGAESTRVGRGDYDENGVCDTRDVIAYINIWFSLSWQADWDCNGVVNSLDLIAFLNTWAPCF